MLYHRPPWRLSRSFRWVLLGCLVSLMYFGTVVWAAGNAYKDGEVISVWVNKIGPFNNPTESYQFYEALRWCRPKVLRYRVLKLGEALQGDRLVNSGYVLPFKQSQDHELLCEKELDKESVNGFIRAIRSRYVYEMQLDGLPMKLFVGHMPESNAQGRGTVTTGKVFLYTHLDFEISCNRDQIIEASALPGSPVELLWDTPAKIRFTYSTTWKASNFPYERRSEKYRDPYHHVDVGIHWFSIANATMSVMLLTAFLGSILARVVKRDFGDIESNTENEDTENQGWKLIAGDVFRFPPALTLLCPFLGSGIQLLIISVVLLSFGVLQVFHPLSQGSLYTASIVLYCLTAGFAGFASGYLYKQLGGSAWVRNALMTVVVFCGPVATVYSFLHIVALAKGSTRAIPFWTLILVIGLWVCATFPLTIFGAIVGKNQSRPFASPVRTSKTRREIPRNPWYRSRLFMTLLAGLLPFSSIYFEIYFVFGSIWGHKIFAVYELMAIIFFILLIVTTITTSSAVYFQLVAEDYRWWWSSVYYGGSVGVYIFLYSVYYYYFNSPLSGFLQASFFFGNMLLVSYAFFLMCSTVGFFAARAFTLFIYGRVPKVD